MVLRKPIPQDSLVPTPLSQAANNPPYPITPITEEPPAIPHEFTPDPNRSPAFVLKTPDTDPSPAETKKNNDGDSDSNISDWERSDDDDDDQIHGGLEDLPAPLKIGGTKGPLVPASKKDSLPEVLKAGPPPGVAIKKSLEKITPDNTGATAASWGGVSNSSGGSIPLKTNNPYLRMQNTGQSNFGAESSQQVWGDAPIQSQHRPEPVELPAFQTPDIPINGMSKLTMANSPPSQSQDRYPDQPPLIAVESPTTVASPRHDSNASQAWDPGMDISSIDAWARTQGLPTDSEPQQHAQRTWQEQQKWEQSERARRQREVAAAHEAAVKADQERRHEEEFHRAEQAAAAAAKAEQEQIYEEFHTPQEVAGLTPASSPPEEDQGPALPPRPSQEMEQQPAMPPQPIDTGADGPSHSRVDTQPTLSRKKNEHYPIKKIRWLDADTRQIRESPILTQNINGPCPLLALANALVLSTPASLRTEFVETLRTREQLSLGLLVDAIIEELMSGRRGTELGDINELYEFLIGLQTGMNVNPMFVHDPEASNGSSGQNTLSASQPGGFENTRDMRLYTTFNVPLLHGWLPEPGSEAYIAFERVAKTYETAQMVQFQEEELDAKLQTGGLNADEQRLFTDIHAIKEFLNAWPTQLTDYGLRNMQQAIKPGQVGILFRNDHFSTLYKNPHTGELMTLVTDQGYATHDEVVWESLVDVSGRGSEFYSGDFRAVGNNSAPQRREQQHVQSMLDVGDDQGWTTVSNNRRRNDGTSSSAAVSSEDPGLPDSESGLNRTEQEDHDLALALQLQEEEEDRHRRTLEERHRRENNLSEGAISQPQSNSGNRRTPRQSEYPPLIPPRRNNAPTTTNRPNAGPAPPPTYEEAATTPQYHPPQGHPANPNTPLRPQGGIAHQPNPSSASLPQGGRRPSGHRPMSNIPQTLPGRLGRRQSGPVGPNGPQEREKCIVM
jgi:hypothetical protein